MEIHEGHPINHCIYFPTVGEIMEDKMQIKCKTCEWYSLNKFDYPCRICWNFAEWEAERKPSLPTCPFCGGESELKHYKDGHVDAYWLKCKAYCPGEQNHKTPEAAIEAYGRRA